MTAATSTAVGSRAAGPGVAQQIYVTHCTQADSIRNQPGFSLRASSTSDPDLLKFALDFPSYELPLDMWGTNPRPQDAPQRLALTAAPGNRVALVHTAFVQFDTRGRPGSYFTHVLVYNNLSPADALRSWGSPQWMLDYPQGGTQKLPEFRGVPGHGRIDDEALRRFLNGAAAGAGSDLATLVGPARLHGDAERCRELLTQALLGCLKAREGSGGRGRFYLLAEPGLCALLLYGACRLAPPGWLDDLTFSTYETAHGGLRQLKLTRTAATYLANPQKGLEADYFSMRGFAVDTFARGRCSDELRAAAPGVAQLVRLAADGDWQGVEELKQYAGGEAVSVPTLESACALAGPARRLRAGSFNAADLQALRRTAQGRRILGEHEEKLVPLVCEWALEQEAIRQEFTDLLRKHIGEVKARAVRELGTRGWERHWNLLEHLLGTSKETRRQHLLEMIGQASGDLQSAPLGPPLLGLLHDWKEVAQDLRDLPVPVWQVLARIVWGKIHEIKTLDLPVEWRAAALLSAASEPARTQEAAGVLREADDGLVRAFCARFNEANPQWQASLLGTLFGPQTDPGLFARLLQNGLALKDKVPDTFLEQTILQGGEWAGYWLQERRLGLLLAGLRQCPEAVGRVWSLYLGGLNLGLLLGDKSQERLFGVFQEARKAPGVEPPRDVTRALDDWALLERQFAHPRDDHGCTPKQLDAACRNRGFTSMQVLAAYFSAVVKDRSPKGREFAAFLHVFTAFVPDEESDAGQLNRARLFFQVLEAACPDSAHRATHQVYFLGHCVAETCRRPIAEQFLREGLLSQPAFAKLAKHLPPAGASAAIVVPDAEAPTGRKSWRTGLAVLACVLVLASVAFGVVARYGLLSSRDPRPGPVARESGPTTNPQETPQTHPAPVVSPSTHRAPSGGTPPTTARTGSSPPDKDPPPKKGDPPVKVTPKPDPPPPDPPQPKPRKGDAEAAGLLVGALIEDIDRVRKEAGPLLGRDERGADWRRRLGDAWLAIERQRKEIDKVVQGALDEEKAEAAVKTAVRAIREPWAEVAQAKRELYRMCLGLEEQKQDTADFLLRLLMPPGKISSARSLHLKVRWFLYEALRCEVRKCKLDEKAEQAITKPFQWLPEWNPDYRQELYQNLAWQLIRYLVKEEAEFPGLTGNAEDVQARRVRLARFLQGEVRPVLGEVLGRNAQALKTHDEAVSNLVAALPPSREEKIQPPAEPPTEDALPVAALAALLRDDVRLFQTDLEEALKRAGETAGVQQALQSINQNLAFSEYPATNRQEKAREGVLARCREIEKTFRHEVGRIKDKVYQESSFPDRLSSPADRIVAALTDWANRPPPTAEFYPAMDEMLFGFVHYEAFLRCHLEGAGWSPLTKVFNLKVLSSRGGDPAETEARQRIRRELIGYFVRRWRAPAPDTGQAESRKQLRVLVEKLSTPLDPKKPRSAPLLAVDPLLKESDLRALLDALSGP